jgi:hypothetical protein
MQNAACRVRSLADLRARISISTYAEIKMQVSIKDHRIYDDQCTASKFHNLVDVISGALPHSKKAAERARTESFF